MKRQMPSTKEIEREIVNRVKIMFRKEFEEATEEEIYRACSEVEHPKGVQQAGS